MRKPLSWAVAFVAMLLVSLGGVAVASPTQEASSRDPLGSFRGMAPSAPYGQRFLDEVASSPAAAS